MKNLDFSANHALAFIMESHHDWPRKHNFVGVSMHTERVTITANH